MNNSTVIGGGTGPINLTDAQVNNWLLVIGILVALIIGYFSIIKRGFLIHMNPSVETTILGGVKLVNVTIKSTRYRENIQFKC